MHIPFLAFGLPDSKEDLQQGANARDKEDGADQVALGEQVVLEAKLSGEDQWDGYETSHGCQEMLGATEKDWVKKDTELAIYNYCVAEGSLKVPSAFVFG